MTLLRQGVVIFFLAVAATWTSTTKLPKDSSLSDKWAKCFHAANLTQFSTSFTCNASLLVHHSLMEFWTHDASLHMCQKREAYGEVMECMLEATKSCLPPEHRLHFPDNNKAREGLNYICNVGEAEKFDVNITCARAHFHEVFTCLHRDTLLVVGNTSPAHLHLICRTFDIADLCSWEALQVCGAETAGAYTRMMSLYFRPPSCTSSAPETTGCYHWMPLVLAAVLSVAI